MSDFNRGFARPFGAPRADMAVDAGLRSFMLGVYNKMALGLVVSGALAWATSHAPIASYLYVVSPDDHLVGITGLGKLLMWAPVVVLLGATFAMRRVTPRSSGILYWTVVGLIGAGMGVDLLIFTGASIASTFFITASAFGALSLYGYATKRDLTGVGSFLIMGMFGLLIAMVLNIFLHSAMMAFAINILGVVIFAGLIAFQTQRLKASYYQMGGNADGLAVATNYGALSLYIDFVNLFQFLLAFTGGRR